MEMAVRLDKPVTLAEFLKEREYRIEAVAVELNGQIIKRGAYETTRLKSDEFVEIVCFVGGG